MAYPIRTGYSVPGTVAGVPTTFSQMDLGQGEGNDCQILSALFLLTGAYLPDHARVARLLLAFLILVHPRLAHLDTATILS